MPENDGTSLRVLPAFFLALLLGAMTLAGCGAGGDSAAGVGNPSSLPAFATSMAVIGQTDSLGVALANGVTDAGGSNDTNPYSLQDPRGMATDPATNRLFLADRSNNRVLTFGLKAGGIDFSSRRAVNVLGQADFDHDDTNRGGTVSDSASDYPDGVSFFKDGAANEWLLVAERDNHRVMIYDITAGITDGMAASVVLGQANFNSTGANRGAGTPSGCPVTGVNGGTLASPRGVLAVQIGARTWLFVADTDNNRILAWDVTTGGIGGLSNGQAADYVIGQEDMFLRSSNRCSSTTDANTLDDPVGLALWVGASNVLVVGDRFNDRVLGFDLGPDGDALVAAALPAGLSAAWVLGQADFFGSSSNRVSTTVPAANSMYAPGHVAVKGSTLFVADSRNNRVVIYDLSALPGDLNATNVFGQADFITETAATAADRMDTPWGLAWVGNRLYVSETGNDRVLSINITPPANFPPALDLLGQTNWFPGMTLDTETPVYTAGGSNDTGTTGLYDPYDAVLGMVLGTQYLFVADNTNQRVLAFETGVDGMPVDLQADFVLGQVDFDHREANALPTATGLGTVKGVAFDHVNGWLFVSDSTHDRVVVWDLSTTFTSAMAASFVLGQPDLTSPTSTGPNHGAGANNGDAQGFDGPRHLAIGDVGGTRYLFVADKWNRRVLAFDLTGGVTMNQAAAFVLGQPTMTSTMTTPSVKGHGKAYGVDFDPVRQWLFVSEARNDNSLDYHNRVLVYDLSGGFIADMDASYVLGQPNFDGVNPATSASGMDYPRDVAYDAVNDRLIVADGDNNRLLAFDLSDGITNGEAAVALNGQPSETANARHYGASRTALSVGNPSGLFIDPVSGLIYSVQEGEDRIMILSSN